MARSRDDRDEYVVELGVTGVAVLSVQAESERVAGATATSRVRPVDVTEIEEVEVRRIVKISEPAATAAAAPSSESPQTPAKGRRHGGQA